MDNTVMRGLVMALMAGGAAADVSSTDMYSTGLPLKEPIALYSENGALSVTLDYTTCDYEGPFATFTTRCYGYDGVGMIPGPSLYVYPGDVLSVTIRNTLSDANDIDYHNFWQHLNKTNLHFHGGHVSATAPSDDVLTMIEPIDSSCLEVDGNTEDDCVSEITYVYDIPTYHMPGTAWYHPHGHGSATLQTGTGSSGFIIIQDTPNVEVPSYITDATEIVVNMNHVNLVEMSKFGTQTCVSSDMFVPDEGSEGSYPTDDTTGEAGIMLINGMTEPVITIEQGVWYRFRFLMASTMYMVNQAQEADVVDAASELLAGCTFKLLAKDTIYLTESLRDIYKIFLYPGSRADVMVQCNTVGEAMLKSILTVDDYSEIAHHTPVWNGNLYTLNVTASSAIEQPALPAFVPPRPCYVADTTSVAGDLDYVTQKPLVYDVCEETSSVVRNVGDDLPTEDEERRLSEDSYEERRRMMDNLMRPWLATEPVSTFSKDVVSPVMHRRQLASAYTIDAYGVYSWTYGEYEGNQATLIDLGAATDCASIATNIFSVTTGQYCVNGCAFEVSTRKKVTQLTTLEDENEAYYATACKVVNDDAHLDIGDIIEWDVWGIDFHPVHFHVNPYQVVEIDYANGNQVGNTITTEEEFNAFTGGFYAVGDFGDSMMIPATHVKVHQQLDSFATTMVMHCHILLHEDIGMMAGFSIEGAEGTHTRAQEIDPSCYWDRAEIVENTLIDSCDDDDDCPSGWACTGTNDSGSRRLNGKMAHARGLKFGSISYSVCEEESISN